MANFIDILKVPHYGSDRNTSKEFFDTISADYYIISANGRDDNPSLKTLKWMIEVRQNANKPRKFVFTNMTPNIKKLLKKFYKKEFNYECVFLEKEDNFLTINIRFLTIELKIFMRVCISEVNDKIVLVIFSLSSLIR